MPRTTSTAECKAKAVLEIIRGDEELGAIASKYGLNPTMNPFNESRLHGWKRNEGRYLCHESQSV